MVPRAVIQERAMQANSSKSELRRKLKGLRREYVTGQPAAIRALLFNRPPAPLLDMVSDAAVIGLYHASDYEAPTASYAKFFLERGHRIALPRFSSKDAAMEFAIHTDPFGESDLEDGPFGQKQPSRDATATDPDVLFVPLVGFTDRGERLGQGGGHYDRWLAIHAGTTTIGLAWDMQLVDQMPIEPHDRRLDAVVTPTRLYGPFS